MNEASLDRLDLWVLLVPTAPREFRVHGDDEDHRVNRDRRVRKGTRVMWVLQELLAVTARLVLLVLLALLGLLGQPALLAQLILHL